MRHRHAWVDCAHPNEQGEEVGCGLLVCIYCGKKRPKEYKPWETI